MIKNQHQDPIINSKSQPSSVQDLNNSDPTSNDTENVQPSENTYVQDEPPHFSEGDIHDSPTRGLSSDISGLTPSPNVTYLENQMEHSPASKTVATQSLRTGRLEMALRDPFPFIENPSFSLGLSREEKQDHTDGRSSQEQETIEEDNQDMLPQRRMSLRLRNSLNPTLPPSTS
ncbi:BnaC08g04190D [Brassica napus]|uniref:BnaC08g04190D protein n=1 Tax=Brassica napus TaxID=3708 RepID=A0A078FTC9_BRANA|nr:BnaC08g04190D [Brassica napus]